MEGVKKSLEANRLSVGNAQPSILARESISWFRF